MVNEWMIEEKVFFLLLILLKFNSSLHDDISLPIVQLNNHVELNLAMSFAPI